MNQIIEYLLCDAGDSTVVVGPLLQRPTDGTASRYTYFIAATCDRRKRFRCDQVLGDAENRIEFIAQLARRPPRVILDMGDELEMAYACESLWPGTHITNVRKRVEAERGKTP
jgi:hypothetical protein